MGEKVHCLKGNSPDLQLRLPTIIKYVRGRKGG